MGQRFVLKEAVLVSRLNGLIVQAHCVKISPLDTGDLGRHQGVLVSQQLREWAENYPPTFAAKHALGSAETARVERRNLDPMRRDDQAVQWAPRTPSLQNKRL